MRRWWRAVLVAGLLVVHPGWVSTALPVVSPVFAVSAAAASPGTTGVRVFSANLNMYNGHTEGIAGQIAREDPDVVLLLEWSPTSSAPLIRSDVLSRYPSRIERMEAAGSDGIALFTRLPLSDATLELLADRYVVTAVIGDGASSFRFIGVHTHSPVTEPKLASWRAQLRELPHVVAREQLPVVLAGDFNATRANAPFARLLSWATLTDAQEAAGNGWAATWPADSRLLPPVVRPDHVLAGPGVQVLDARVGDSSGSDHRPVMVDLVVTRP
jgi:endonuclease/exonuclease/phosphatase (EEP) superfamily protein YafD